MMTIRAVGETLQLKTAGRDWATIYPRPWGMDTYWGLADYMDLAPMPSVYQAARDSRMAQVSAGDDGWTYEYGWHTAHWHRPCSFCGHVFWHNQDACPQCAAPTPAWWARLDAMISKWKRGG